MKDDETIFLSTPSVRRATCEAQMIDTELVISIHALREEGDVQVDIVPGADKVFLSTPSVRRATSRYPCERAGAAISIHALREEGDPPWTPSSFLFGDFYPRPP